MNETISDTEIAAINAVLQSKLKSTHRNEVPAIEAARWLDAAGILKDSLDRRGLPLRRLLREGRILGQRQEPNKRWFIDRVSG